MIIFESILTSSIFHRC